MTPPQSESDDLNYGIVLPSSPAYADGESVIEYAVAAENAGWDGVFLGDHLIYPWDDTDPQQAKGVYDPWITLAGIASQTNHIKLGTRITPVPRRQPWQLARNLATLDHLSDGRVLCGAGLGTKPDFVKFDQPYDKQKLGSQYDEALDVITGLWTGEPFTYDGTYYTIDEAVMLPTPVQEPRIPIVIGCWWPNKKPFRRGARWDGIMPATPAQDGEGPHGLEETGSPEEEVREMLEYYHGLTDEPGEIFLPIDPPISSAEYADVCTEYDVTWLYTSELLASDQAADETWVKDRIRTGPPT